MNKVFFVVVVVMAMIFSGMVLLFSGSNLFIAFYSQRRN